MPIEWLLVGQAALNAGAGLAAKGVLGKAAKAGAALFRRGGPIDKDLAGAIAKAGEGFEASLYASYPDDRELSALVAQLAEREDFQQALGSLPYVPFASIDVDLVRQVFVERRGTDDAGEDFDGAWRAASKRFAQAAAKKEEVGRFVQLQHHARSEQREEMQVATIGEIRSLLEKIDERQARAEAPPDEEPILAAYRRGVYEEFRYADTSGLFQREKVAVGEAIGLEEIFVETLLGREPERRFEPEESGGKANNGSEKGRRQPEALREPIEILPIREVLARDRLTVILGPPGSGKSTLMRCLALSVCRPADAPPPVLDTGFDSTVIPVILALKEYASALRDDSSLELEPFLLDRFASKLPHLKELLDSSRVILLLDGFDEVFDERHRIWVRDQVWRLASRYSASRFVLTSRPHGYASAPLPGPVAVWKVQPFEEEEIPRFLRGWFTALSREGGETGATETPERRAEGLAQEILSRERLKEMAENPLLCTLIVLVHRDRSGRLPDRRVVFFEAAVKTFAESWERAKHAPVQTGEDRYEFPEPEILLRALAEVAWRAHHELDSRQIPGEKLREWLGAYLDGEPDWSGARGRRAVSDFLRLVDQRTGLLVDLGGGAYQIVHLSLHEWFVSYYLLDRLSSDKRLEVLRHYLHVPEWEEVLRLTIAGARQAEAEAMIAAILDHPSHVLEKRLKRDFRFVLRCLEDHARIGLELRQRVVGEVLQALHDPDLIVQTELIAALSPLGSVPEIRDYFLRQLDDNFIGRSSAVIFFAKVSAFDEPVRHLFLQELENDHPDIRSSAALFFLQASISDEIVCQAFLRRLYDDDPSVRSSAVSFFSLIGASDDTVRHAVLKELADEDPSVRYAAVSFFAQTGATDDTVRQAILPKLDDEDPSVRDAAVSFFAKISASDDTVRGLFLRRLEGGDPDVRQTAVSFFARIGASDESVRHAVFRRLDDAAPSVRDSAVFYFVRIAAADNTMRQVFLQRLETEDPQTQSSAVDFFTQIGADDDTVRKAILRLFDNQSPKLRLPAIRFFAKIGTSTDTVRQSILRLLKDESFQVQAIAFQSAFQGEFLPLDAGAPLDLFRRLAKYTPWNFWSLFSYEIGRSAAIEATLRQRLIEEAPKIKLFQVGAALEGLVAEEDRLRREANPLPF